MGLKIYQNKETGEVKKSLKPLDPEIWEVQISVPHTKFMVNGDSEHGISKLKDQEKILRARSRNHSRDRELDDNIQVNKANGLDESVARNFLNKNGTKRTKLDDL